MTAAALPGVMTMNATDPTYFLYSGRLFHETALPALLAQMDRRSSAASSSTSQPRTEDPGPEGPEGEPVGEEDEDDESDGVPTQREMPDEKSSESKPLPGPGLPIVPEHGTPDANPIDPRVF
jgi:hypothetical protein